MRPILSHAFPEGRSLGTQVLWALEELLRIAQVLVPIAAFATAIALTYYIGDNLAYTAYHHNDNIAHQGRLLVLDDNLPDGYMFKHFRMFFSNASPQIYNIDRASVILTTGLLCMTMNLSIVVLLIKRVSS